MAEESRETPHPAGRTVPEQFSDTVRPGPIDRRLGRQFKAVRWEHRLHPEPRGSGPTKGVKGGRFPGDATENGDDLGRQLIRIPWRSLRGQEPVRVQPAAVRAPGRVALED